MTGYNAKKFLDVKDLPAVLTVAEASGFLRVCRRTVYNLVQEKRLKVLMVGKRIRIPRDALLSLMP